MITYFGTGLLGSGFVRHMLDRGETVHVWNRTYEKAQALEEFGAKAFREPAEAVRGAAQIHLTLSDDAAVDGILEPLAGVIAPETIIADHTTTAPTPTGERVQRWTARGRTFVSGEPSVRARVKPLLEPMTGKVVELGDDPTRGAAFKLLGNMMLLVITGGLADFFTFARSLGIKPTEAYALFSEFNPGNMIQGRGKQMAEGISSPPRFELSMARKDLRLMVEEAARHRATLDVLPAVGSLFDRYIAAGHGSEDAGVVASGDA